MREDGHNPARDPTTGQIVPTDPGDFEPTPKQAKFINALADGLPPVAAARLAGYAVPNVECTRLRRSPAVRARIRRLQELKLDKIASLSLRRLEELIADPETPVNALITAITFTLTAAGHAGKDKPKDNDTGQRNIRAMSLAELESYVAQRFDETKNAGSGKTIDADPGERAGATDVGEGEPTTRASGSER